MAVLVTVGFCVVTLATVSNENVTEYTSSESQSLGLLHENMGDYFADTGLGKLVFPKTKVNKISNNSRRIM